MAMIESALANALNALLEEERASVEMEVALASGATDYMERLALAAMGGDDLDACCDLHAHLDRLEVMISRRIHGAVYIVLSEERYDARLRAFAYHQRMVGAHAEALLEADLDHELRRILTEIRDAHVRHSLWSEDRANEFAATRTIDFHTPAGRAILRRPVGGAPAASPEASPEATHAEVADTDAIEERGDVADSGSVRERGDVADTESIGEGGYPDEQVDAADIGEETEAETEEAPGVPLPETTLE